MKYEYTKAQKLIEFKKSCYLSLTKFFNIIHLEKLGSKAFDQYIRYTFLQFDNEEELCNSVRKSLYEHMKDVKDEAEYEELKHSLEEANRWKNDLHMRRSGLQHILDEEE